MSQRDSRGFKRLMTRNPGPTFPPQRTFLLLDYTNSPREFLARGYILANFEIARFYRSFNWKDLKWILGDFTPLSGWNLLSGSW